MANQPPSIQGLRFATQRYEVTPWWHDVRWGPCVQLTKQLFAQGTILCPGERVGRPCLCLRKNMVLGRIIIAGSLWTFDPCHLCTLALLRRITWLYYHPCIHAFTRRVLKLEIKTKLPRAVVYIFFQPHGLSGTSTAPRKPPRRNVSMSPKRIQDENRFNTVAFSKVTI